MFALRPASRGSFRASGRLLPSSATALALLAGTAAASDDMIREVFAVSAIDHSIYPPAENGAPLATGIVFAAGDKFIIAADPEGRWSNQPGGGYDAHGSAQYRNWDLGGGRTANVGALLASVGPWDFFPAGLNWSGHVTAPGELYLGFFDAADAGYDNSGVVSVTIIYPPPLP